MKILISGASFAGLCSAYWMRELGHEVTVVETAPGLRLGGTPVDIRENTVDVVRRMGMLDAIRAEHIGPKRFAFLDAEGQVARTLDPPTESEPSEFEIERDALLHMLFGAVKGSTTFVFDDSIVGLHETLDGIDVTFRGAAPRTFDLVLGCDGMRSAVRRLWFGPEKQYVHFLRNYFSITIVDKLLIERNSAQIFNVPGRAITLCAYNNKTDIIFNFIADDEIAYDHRSESQQRAIINAQFAGLRWRTPELLDEVARSKSFYFDKLAQVRMPSWFKGRVALVGDAGYCASPAAGMGGSLAIDGAAALADAMRKSPEDHTRAFRAYDDGFRPFIDEVQARAVHTSTVLVPRTDEAIRERNSRTSADF